MQDFKETNAFFDIDAITEVGKMGTKQQTPINA